MRHWAWLTNGWPRCLKSKERWWDSPSHHNAMPMHPHSHPRTVLRFAAVLVAEIKVSVHRRTSAEQSIWSASEGATVMSVTLRRMHCSSEASRVWSVSLRVCEWIRRRVRCGNTPNSDSTGSSEEEHETDLEAQCHLLHTIVSVEWVWASVWQWLEARDEVWSVSEKDECFASEASERWRQWMLMMKATVSCECREKTSAWFETVLSSPKWTLLLQVWGVWTVEVTVWRQSHGSFLHLFSSRWLWVSLVRIIHRCSIVYKLVAIWKKSE